MSYIQTFHHLFTFILSRLVLKVIEKKMGIKSFRDVMLFIRLLKHFLMLGQLCFGHFGVEYFIKVRGFKHHHVIRVEILEHFDHWSAINPPQILLKEFRFRYFFHCPCEVTHLKFRKATFIYSTTYLHLTDTPLFSTFSSFQFKLLLFIHLLHEVIRLKPGNPKLFSNQFLIRLVNTDTRTIGFTTSNSHILTIIFSLNNIIK